MSEASVSKTIADKISQCRATVVIGQSQVTVHQRNLTVHQRNLTVAHERLAIAETNLREWERIQELNDAREGLASTSPTTVAATCMCALCVEGRRLARANQCSS